MFDDFVPEGYVSFRDAIEIGHQQLQEHAQTNLSTKETEDKLRSLLFAEKLKAWIIDRDGNLVLVPRGIWASAEHVANLMFGEEIRSAKRRGYDASLSSYCRPATASAISSQSIRSALTILV